MTGWKSHHEVLFENIDIQDVYVHTNYFSDGAVWSNAWFTWSAEGQTTGEEYSNRGHFDYRWEDGKIVELWLTLANIQKQLRLLHMLHLRNNFLILNKKALMIEAFLFS